MNDAEPRQPVASPLTLGMLYGRALRLRCPLCGVGRMFSGWFRMIPACSNCGLVYEREPGYFLGATYVNYGIIVLPVTFLYILLHFQLGWPNEQLRWLAGLCLVVPLLTFRYARALWLALDCRFDTSIREEVQRKQSGTSPLSEPLP